MERETKPASGIPRLSSRLPVPRGSLKNSFNKSCLSNKRPEALRLGRNQSPERPQTRQGTADVAVQTVSNSLPTAEDGLLAVSAVISASDHTSSLTNSGVRSCETADDTPPQDGRESPIDEGIIEPVTGLNIGYRCETNEVLSSAFDSQPQTPRQRRRPRPSLSDRTIETLSQVPPSPASTRRRSSYFSRDDSSPMRPPLRPASAMSNTRTRPSSPTKRPPVPTIPISFAPKSKTRTVPGRHSMTQPAEINVSKPATKPPAYAKTSAPITSGSARTHGSSKLASTVRRTKSSMTKPPLSQLFTKEAPGLKSVAAAKSSGITAGSRKTPSKSTTITASSSSYRSRPSPLQPSKSCSTMVDANSDGPSKKPLTPSAALRNAIAKAKEDAAKKKAPASPMRQKPNPSISTMPGFEPVQAPTDSSDVSDTLRQRINTALLSGHLNVAAMSFRSFPPEIKHMYGFSDQARVNWSECVDLTKLTAADNELDVLEDDLFPDMNDVELEDADGPEYRGIFRGLEFLDLHGNTLKELPLGFNHLQKLRSLNLSGNKLGVQALGTICQLGKGLKELRIANNELSGILPEQLKNLRNLQVLDLHANKITELPSCLQELVHLKTLNLAQNKLMSIPSGILTDLALVELLISGNQLSGSLFPSEIQSVTSLRLLDASHNLLDALASPNIELPNIQTLDLRGNKLKTLPEVSSWTRLLTFGVAENQISEIPAGLTMLSMLRNVDFSFNNITRLHEGIASMESLVAINLAGNPLRERKYLTMSADDIKADLQKRTMRNEIPLEEDMAIPSSSSVSKGILDLSSRSMSDPNVPSVNPEQSIFDLRLHHNTLSSVPTSILSHPSISETLKYLDLSHNPLTDSYLSSPLTLPHIASLTLASCTLTSLSHLTTHLSAPRLSILNISANHLSGPLPSLRRHFSSLITLLAADNRFTALDVNAVRGLTTLDVRNNEIGYLEPRLGIVEGLKGLEVQGNRFRVPRWDVLEKGTEAVLRWLRGRVPAEELEGERGEE